MQLTAHQQRVLAALQQVKGPLSAYALLDRLRGDGFSAATQVYRALERLAAYGMVHRLETLNAYVSCAHSNDCRHDSIAFAICETCGHVEEIADKNLGHCISRRMNDSAFSVRTATIELLGTCTTCSRSLLFNGGESGMKSTHLESVPCSDPVTSKVAKEPR
jgi:Fur family transcriptional regulator, zinc uptake regulator